MKIRCSQIGQIMTNPQTKKDKDAGNLGATVKSFCITLLAQKYGREQDITNKYLEKGKSVEDDSITLFSKFTGTFYDKNETRFDNDYLTGEPDIIHNGAVYDIKSCWDLVTFTKHMYSTLDKHHEMQLQGYMDLTGCKKAYVVYCLTNATATLISDEKSRAFYKYGNTDSEEYIEDCKQIERNMIYDLPQFLKDNPGFDLDSDPETWDYDIDYKKRVHIKEVNYDPELIGRIYERVERVREYVKEIDFLNA